MIHSRSLIDIITEVVADISVEMLIQSVTDNGDGTFDLMVSDLKWAEPGRTVTVNGFEFTIDSIDDETNTIVLSGTDTIYGNTTTFDLYAPVFSYGTPVAINNELQQIQESKDKTPTVLLMLKFTERFNTDMESMVERESTCSLYFLTQADFDAWQTGDYYQNAIRPMRRLMDLFIDQVKSDYRFDTTEYEFNAIDLPQFGVYVTTKGAINSWFGDNLSGVQMDSVFKINRTSDCESTAIRNAGVGYDTIAIDNNVN